MSSILLNEQEEKIKTDLPVTLPPCNIAYKTKQISLHVIFEIVQLKMQINWELN